MPAACYSPSTLRNGNPIRLPGVAVREKLKKSTSRRLQRFRIALAEILKHKPRVSSDALCFQILAHKPENRPMVLAEFNTFFRSEPFSNCV